MYMYAQSFFHLSSSTCYARLMVATNVAFEICQHVYNCVSLYIHTRTHVYSGTYGHFGTKSSWLLYILR